MENKIVLNWIGLKKPLNFSKIFKNYNPVLVEIGFGNGEFLQKIVPDYPNFNFIGVEISKTCIRKAKSRLKNFKNVKLLKCYAELFLSYMCSPNSIYGIFLNFPDPWFKKKHIRTKRFIKPYTIKLMAYCLKKGGFISFLTDWEEYALWVEENFAKFDYFKKISPVFDEEYFYTKYRRKWEKEGRNFYHLWYGKVKDPENFMPIAPQKLEDNMYILHLENINFAKVKEKLKNLDERIVYHKKIESLPGQAYLIKFLKTFWDKNEEVFLVKTLVKEPYLEHKFFIEIKFGKGEIEIKPSSASGEIEFTRMLKKSIDLLAEYLKDA